MIDCGKCGYEQMHREADGSCVCGHCGRVYTKEEAEQREQAMNRLTQKRKLQIAMMACSALFLIICAIMLPGYTNGTVKEWQMLSATAVCAAFFAAALAFRISYGRERRKLYAEK